MNKRKTRIFLINQTDESQKFGIGRYISEMAYEAKKRKHYLEMIVVTIGSMRISNVLQRFDENVLFFDIPRTIEDKDKLLIGLSEQYSVAIFYLLMDVFKISNSDIFHFNNNMQYYLLKKIKENTNAKIIYTIHVSLWRVFYKNNRKQFLLNWKKNEIEDTRIINIQVESKNCSMAHSVICLTSEMADDAIKYYSIPKSKLNIVQNGISVNQIGAIQDRNKSKGNSYFKNKETFTFLYVGRLTEQKGIKRVLEAFRHLIKRVNKPLALLIVGEGPLRKTIEYMGKKYGITIHFTGYVTPLEMPQYYSLSNALVFPSLNEQSSYVMLEAMKYRLPMILSDIPAFKHLKNGEHCLKVKTNDDDCLANTMAIMVESTNQRNDIVENAYKLFLKNYTASRMFQQSYAFLI